MIKTDELAATVIGLMVVFAVGAYLGKLDGIRREHAECVAGEEKVREFYERRIEKLCEDAGGQFIQSCYRSCWLNVENPDRGVTECERFDGSIFSPDRHE